VVGLSVGSLATLLAVQISAIVSDAERSWRKKVTIASQCHKENSKSARFTTPNRGHPSCDYWLTAI